MKEELKDFEEEAVIKAISKMIRFASDNLEENIMNSNTINEAKVIVGSCLNQVTIDIWELLEAVRTIHDTNIDLENF